MCFLVRVLLSFCAASSPISHCLPRFPSGLRSQQCRPGLGRGCPTVPLDNPERASAEPYRTARSCTGPRSCTARAQIPAPSSPSRSVLSPPDTVAVGPILWHLVGRRSTCHLQCVFDYATRGHFIVACFEFTFRSSFGVCHCKIGRTCTTTTGSPGCGLLATCTDSKPTRCKQKVPRPTDTVFANSAIKQTTEKKTALQLR